MDHNLCEKCRQGGTILLRQSDQMLCEECWTTGSPSKQAEPPPSSLLEVDTPASPSCSLEDEPAIPPSCLLEVEPPAPPSCLPGTEPPAPPSCFIQTEDDNEEEIDQSFRFSTPSLFGRSSCQFTPNNLGLFNTPQVSQEDPSQLSRPKVKERLVRPRPNPGLASTEKSYLTKEPQQKTSENNDAELVNDTDTTYITSEVQPQDNPLSLKLKIKLRPETTALQPSPLLSCTVADTATEPRTIATNKPSAEINLIDRTKLVSYIAFTKCSKTGKEHCKFNGNAEELDSFLKSVLKLKGNWSQTKDSLNHKIFKSEYATISWWKSTKTLSVSGKCEDYIRKQLKSLSSNAKSQKSSTENTGPHTHQKITDDHSSSSSSHIQQELKNVWSAIHSLFTSNVQTGSDIVSLVKHEREINHRLNEELRLLCSENSSLQVKNNTLSEKIKELETTIRDLELNLDFDQDMNMWKKPKKPAPRKEITPPTWGKINMNNKYDSLLHLDRLSESDDQLVTIQLTVHLDNQHSTTKCKQFNSNEK